jgi:glycerol-3-phosphate dehydrogenase
MRGAVDVAIIGGGINGTAIAQSAAAAGHQVLLLEQAPGLAQGTSSRSSKLIHGGLRYLEHGQLSLVRESLRERALLLRNAPELVRLVPFHIPVFETSRRGPLTVRAGLSLYALLASLRPESLFRSLPARAWGDLDGLRTTGLRAVFRHYDAQTDDAALTQAVMRSAQGLGARFLTAARVTRVDLDDGGALIAYEHDSRSEQCRARVVVNAAGAWVNELLARVSPPVPPLAIDLVQGTHIVVPGTLRQGVYYLESPRDSRPVFMMPWKGRILIGTTETPYTGDPGAVRPLAGEVDYLLETLAHHFPSRAVDRQGVAAAFAGLRVLPRAQGSAFARTRESIFLTDRERAPRLLCVYGGKLTVHRATAEKALATIRSSLPPRGPVVDTKRLKLAL